MKKMMIMAILLVGMTSFAQTKAENGDRPQKPTVEERVEMMASELNLNNKQKKELTTLFEKHEVEREERMKKGERPKDKRPPKDMKSSEDMKSKRAKHDEELKAILTDAQYEKFQTLKEERRKNHKKGDRNKSK